MDPKHSGVWASAIERCNPGCGPAGLTVFRTSRPLPGIGDPHRQFLPKSAAWLALFGTTSGAAG